MTRAYIGIDPGADGAIVALPAHHDEAPRAVRARGADGYQRGTLRAGLTVALYLDALRAVAEGYQVAGVVVEMPSTRPGESGSSGQLSGMHVGAWLGLLAALGWPYRIERPQAWRKAAGIVVPKGADPKGATISTVMARLPDLDLTPGRIASPHTGIADAAGMALAARGWFR